MRARNRILRYAVGVTLAAAFAYAVNWPLSFLLPVLIALFFGINVFYERSAAQYYNSALIALLILVNGSMGEDAAFTEKFIMRVILITLAVLYTVTALRVLD